MSKRWWHGWRLPKGGAWQVERFIPVLPEPPSWWHELGKMAVTFLPRIIRHLVVGWLLLGNVGALRVATAGSPTIFPSNAVGNFPNVYNVKLYGAKGDGVAATIGSGTDDTVAIQAAFTAAAAGGGGTVYFPPGIYNITSTINIETASSVKLGNIRIVGAGQQAVILRPTVTPMFLVGGPLGSVTDGFSAEDFNVQLTTHLYYGAGIIKLRLCREWTFKRIGLVSGVDIQNDLYVYEGYLFEFDSSYQGTVEKCFANGKGVYLFDFHDITDPAQQCDTFTFINCVVTGIGFGLIHAPSGSTDDHNIELLTCKHLLISTWNEANVSVETTLSSAPAAGATSFTVTSATGLHTGDYVWVDIGTNLELVKILNLTGTTITCQPLRFAHASGAQLFMGGMMLSTAPKCHGVWLDHPHCEFSAVGVLIAGANNVRVTDLYGTVKEVLRIVDGTNITKGNIVERGEWHWNGAGVQCAVRVTTAGDNAGHGPVMIRGPIIDPNTGNPPATLYQNDAGTTRSLAIFDTISSGQLIRSLIFPTTANLIYDQVSVQGGLRFSRNLLGQTFAQVLNDNAPALTWGASVAVDLSLGNYFRLTATSNIAATIANPTNPPPNGQSQEVIFEIFNNTGGALTTPVAFGTNYLTSGGVSPGNGLTITVTFRYDWSRAKYIEKTRSAAV